MASKDNEKPLDIDDKFEKYIEVIKYSLFFLNIITWMIGIAAFVVAIWLRFEPGFSDWVEQMELQNYYIGIYILFIVAVTIIAVSFLGCAAAFTENQVLCFGYIVSQGIGFFLGILGTAFLMEYSTYGSHIQPIVRDVMMRLIMDSQYERSKSKQILAMVQENIGCCGADGANDYIMLKHEIPPECRDTVTGNAFFYGCGDELTWFMQGKTVWLTTIALTLCFLNVINGVLTTLYLQILRKEEIERADASRYNSEFN